MLTDTISHNNEPPTTCKVCVLRVFPNKSRDLRDDGIYFMKNIDRNENRLLNTPHSTTMHTLVRQSISIRYKY